MENIQEKPFEIIKEYVIMLVCFGIGIVLFMVEPEASSSEFSVLFISIAGLYFIKALRSKTFDYLQDYLEYSFPKHWIVSLLVLIPMICVFVFVIAALWKEIIIDYILQVGTFVFMFALSLPLIKQFRNKKSIIEKENE